MVNPKVKKGDRILLLYMRDEISVPIGTEGTVRDVTRDPFEPDSEIIMVKWDNGSSLNILTSQDMYKKINDPIEDLTENLSQAKFLVKNEYLFDNFDWRFINLFLEDLRQSGITNMFGSSPFLYMGRKTIKRYYGENPPNPEAFKKVLDNAEKVKQELIDGTIKSAGVSGGLEKLESQVKNNARKFVNLFMVYH